MQVENLFLTFASFGEDFGYLKIRPFVIGIEKRPHACFALALFVKYQNYHEQIFGTIA